MMTFDQLKSFDISQEPASVLTEYGDSAFGRDCLAARRLIEAGVRCVEVMLDGWDSHVNNHEVRRKLVKQLDPAFAALLRDLARHQLLDRTIVLCCGEFGRMPKINPFGGRDHWPTGFSLAIAGGGLRGGQAIGATDPEGPRIPLGPPPSRTSTPPSSRPSDSTPSRKTSPRSPAGRSSSARAGRSASSWVDRFSFRCRTCIPSLNSSLAAGFFRSLIAAGSPGSISPTRETVDPGDTSSALPGTMPCSWCRPGCAEIAFVRS